MENSYRLSPLGTLVTKYLNSILNSREHLMHCMRGSQQIREKSRKRQKIEQRDGITSGSRRWASGSPVAERVRREDSETDARGLCRWQWQTFCDAIRARTDPFSGGVPQLVSLYNNGNGRIGIEYGLAFGPCLSSP
jgi:hypothetical protein